MACGGRPERCEEQASDDVFVRLPRHVADHAAEQRVAEVEDSIAVAGGRVERYAVAPTGEVVLGQRRLPIAPRIVIVTSPRCASAARAPDLRRVVCRYFNPFSSGT